MAGIYIPGMEMPQRDEVITIFPDGTAHLHHLGLRLNISQSKAVPVPPHGRLGDLDAAVEKLKRVREYHSDDSQSGVSIAEGISQCIEVLTGKEAPTIIPADKEGIEWAGKQ